MFKIITLCQYNKNNVISPSYNYLLNIILLYNNYNKYYIYNIYHLCKIHNKIGNLYDSNDEGHIVSD